MQQPTDDPALNAAIARAYEVFQPYRATRPLTVCHCGMCLANETESLLLESPLHEIGSFELSDYNSAAQGDPAQIQVQNELRYFLPRFLELIAQDEQVHFADPCLTLRQLGRIDYRKHWPAAEVQAIDTFFEAYLGHQLNQPIGWTTTRHGDPLAYSTIADELCLTSYGGGNIAALLTLWAHHESLYATSHLAVTVNKWLADASDSTLTITPPAFWDDRAADAHLIIDWLARPQSANRLRTGLPPNASPELAALFTSAESIVSKRSS